MVFFPIHFSVITRAPIGQNGELKLKTNDGFTKMASGSDDSEFAEFNSSKARKEFKERQEKLKRKEISSRKFGRMMVFDIVGDLYKDRKTCKNELMKLRMSQKIKTFSR